MPGPIQIKGQQMSMEMRFLNMMTLEGMEANVPNGDDGFNNGLNYSLVDLTLNGGNGDVVTYRKKQTSVNLRPIRSPEASEF